MGAFVFWGQQQAFRSGVAVVNDIIVVKDGKSLSESPRPATLVPHDFSPRHPRARLSRVSRSARVDAI